MSLYSNLLQGTCTTKALWFLFHTDLLELNSSKIDRLPRNRSRTWNGWKRFFIGGEGVGKMAIRLKTVPGRNCKKCRKLFESGSAASDFQQLECNTILILDIFFHSERLFSGWSRVKQLTWTKALNRVRFVFDHFWDWWLSWLRIITFFFDLNKSTQ